MTAPMTAFAQASDNSTTTIGNVTGSPKILLPPTVGLKILDPNGDDTFEVNCVYAGVEYSPGSVVNMPGGNKTCHSSGNWI